MKFKKLNKLIMTPTRGHNSDAGLDIYAPATIMVPGHSISPRINLGVAFEIPQGYCGWIVERSSQGRLGIKADYGPVVDHGYTGYVHVTLVNSSEDGYIVHEGEKICQMLLLKVGMEELEEVVEFEETERGANSHGSTGK